MVHQHSSEHIIYGYLTLGVSVVAVLAIHAYYKYQLARRIPFRLGPLAFYGVWLCMLMVFCFVHRSSSGLNVISRRAGRVTYSALPLTLFLTLRPTPLPNTMYLACIFIHKWVARSAVLFSTFHAIGYICYFVKSGTTEKIFHFLNFLGVILFIMMIAITVSSLKPVRERFYKWFYAIHYPLAWAIVILGWIHARPSTAVLSAICILILMGQVFYRLFASKSAYATVEQLSSTLYHVKFDRRCLPENFVEGSHLRVSTPLNSPLTWIRPTHPYTIASLNADDEISLVVRNTEFKIVDGQSYSLTGPYDSLDLQLWSAESVIIIVGGSAISLGAPVLRKLQLKDIPARLIWITRDKGDLEALSVLGVDSAEVYITGTALEQGSTGESVSTEQGGGDNDAENGVLADGENGESHQLLESSAFSSAAGSGLSSISVKLGRPNFTSIDRYSTKSTRRWVLSAGAESLVADVKLWAEARKYNFASQAYMI